MATVKHGGGWHAIAYTLKKAREAGPLKLARAMASKNACKTCALGMGGQLGGMRNEQGHFPEFCKKSLQAMASDMQKPIPEELFKKHSISELRHLTERQLDSLGRIGFPLLRRKGSNHFERISWDEVYSKIAQHLRKADPERSFFYFSGRSSNEAGFLLQLFCRIYGTNHVNNCSFYCHQASGVGLSASIGSGTATIQLADLEKTDLLFIIGANPASNHPRLMSICKDIRRRGGHVVVINPLKEQGLVKFSVPSDFRSLLRPTSIASHYIQVKPGGDLALFTWISKILHEKFNSAVASGFIDKSTHGYSEFAAYLSTVKVEDLKAACGIDEKTVEELALLYQKSNAAVFSWAMGVTHHLHGADTVQAITNLALQRGMVGKPGAGLLPIRGHSNVQGMGSMAVKPELSPQEWQAFENIGVKRPDHKGFDTMSCMEAAHRKDIDFGFCLGGNLFGSNPDSSFAEAALEKIPFMVYLNTTLNSGHVHGLSKEALILPVRARDEESDATTQESMFNLVRISDGGPSRLDEAKSETEIVCNIALSAIDKGLKCPESISFDKLKSHQEIRKLISRTLKPFSELAKHSAEKKEFHIPGRILHDHTFPTPDGKAKFFIPSLDVYTRHPQYTSPLTLLTIRSEGQFNTVVFEEHDRYRNQERRDVILMNEKDIARLDLIPGDEVTVVGESGELGPIIVRSHDIVEGAAAMYYPEANALLSRRVDPRTGTPAFKAAPISIIKLNR